MAVTVSIDKAGRLVLPQHVRRQFRLTAGDRLGVEILPDGILLRAGSSRAALVEERGLFVHEGDADTDVARSIDMVREARDAEVSGLIR